ncbi:hypothetical protein GDO81_014715 [Engystomops pustulosus]|uniref:Ig-like domain-containing protein n=1 Tax=Engystomops pustulosus TaxID=76066 RepID=A0AAV7BBZ6_ENGPU|nr:hypothetical protein GDO81_014715 [Engystomops pustulosus]
MEEAKLQHGVVQASACMTCSPPGNCPATSLTFQWRKSNVPGIWKNSPSITFTPSLDDHGTTITCEMSHSKGKTTQKTLLLHVYKKPEIFKDLQCKRNMTVIYCECSAMANPPASITWSSTGINVTETSGFSIKSSSHGYNTVSRLEGSVMSPPGDILCTAGNTEGSESQKLPIYEKPQILQESHCRKNLSAIYCECSAMANPPASITWSSTGINVTETSGFSINSSSGYRTVSRLEGAAMSRPGDIWCTAENTEGSVSQKLPIYVDWTRPLLIGGGIIAFLILGITCAVFAIKNCRVKKNISRSNSYVMEGPNNNAKAKDPESRNEASRNTKRGI